MKRINPITFSYRVWGSFGIPSTRIRKRHAVVNLFRKTVNNVRILSTSPVQRVTTSSGKDNPYRHLGKGLVSVVERWDKSTFQRVQEETSGSDKNYNILRLIIDEGAIITYYFELYKQLSTPDTDWNDVKEPLSNDYIDHYDCFK